MRRLEPIRVLTEKHAPHNINQTRERRIKERRDNGGCDEIAKNNERRNNKFLANKLNKEINQTC